MLWSEETTEPFAGLAEYAAPDFKIFWNVARETHTREPYSWGEGRGEAVGIMATISHVIIGSAELARTQLVAMFGEPAIAALELSQTERLHEIESAQ